MWRLTLQVQLKVYSEEDSRNARTQDEDLLLTSKVPVREFGSYVESLHANSNKNFRDQFFVSHSVVCVCVHVCICVCRCT